MYHYRDIAFYPIAAGTGLLIKGQKGTERDLYSLFKQLVHACNVKPGNCAQIDPDSVTQKQKERYL